jgi:hypothetical protein
MARIISIDVTPHDSVRVMGNLRSDSTARKSIWTFLEYTEVTVTPWVPGHAQTVK